MAEAPAAARPCEHAAILVASVPWWVGNDTRCSPPVMAGPVPAIPMRRSAALQTIGITGTRPVMTAEGAVGGCEG